VGSITHCHGYRAAAVADSATFATIGIDAEPHAQLHPGVLSVIAAEPEIAWAEERLCVSPGIAWDRLLFCMKEAAFKAWTPLVAGTLGFQDALISVGPSNQTFTTWLRQGVMASAGGARPELAGNWLVSEDLIVAAVIEPAEHSKTSPFICGI
jgi:4'-phosphopantetheinyl transferase EntD